MEKINETTRKIYEYDLSLLSSDVILGGADEAGRGPLCGPVVCAAVVMDYTVMINKINDSKKVSEKVREELFEFINKNAKAVSVSIIEPSIIDEINILQATKLGMKRAIEGLKLAPTLMLIDAVKGLDVTVRTMPIIKGDATSYSIAAASIVAKVTRDRIMLEYALKYPEFNFAKNKGYGTQEHIAALKKYGATEIHRTTFIKNFNLQANIRGCNDE